jgi:two-component system chemotaxis sensor kinase CheA
VSASDAFLAEAAELADSFATRMSELRIGEPADEAVRELFRFAHSLKGMSAMEGIAELNRLAHANEDLLDRYRTGGRRPTADELDALLESADAMSALVDELASGSPLTEQGGLVSRLTLLAADEPRSTGSTTDGSEAAATGEEIGDAGDPLPGDTPAASVVLHVTLAADAALPGARAAVLLRQLGAATEVVFTRPDRDAITSGSARDFLVGLDLPTIEPASGGYAEALAPLLERLATIPDVATVAVRERAADEPTGTREPTGTTEATATTETTETTAGPSDPSAVSAPAPTVRVESSRLDALLDVTGELVIERNRLDALVGATADADLKRTLADLRRTVGDLERLVQRVRMVPIAPVFTRLQRLVRETARDLGTPVSLRVEGESTEVDRSVADEILQPMVHLLRNAIDHGIEAAEVRAQRGKPPTGTLVLRAEQQGNHVVFEVTDDGGGLDDERIAAKALASGVLDARQVSGLDRASILDLIFAPGFSTNEDVSLVSGRGVGLDVVRAAVNRFGGGIEVDSEPGAGTTFRIRLPLSLVVVDALVVRVATELWALPLQRLVETVSLRPGAIREAPGPTGRVVAHRSGLLPAIDGGTMLAVGEPIEAPCPAVVIETVGRPYVLTVDELVGHGEMVVRPVPVASGVDHLAGVATLADGRLALVLDVAAFVDAATFRAAPRTAEAPERADVAGPHPRAGEDAAAAFVDVGAEAGTESDLVDLGPDADERPDQQERRSTERDLFDAGIRRTQPVLDHFIRATSTVSETTSREVGEVAAAVVAHAEVVPVAFTLGGDLHAVLVFAIVAETQLLEAMGARVDQHAAAIDELANMLGSQFVAALADEHRLSVTLSTPMRPERTADDIVYLLRGATPRAEAPPVWHAAMLGGPEPIQVLLAVDPDPIDR